MKEKKEEYKKEIITHSIFTLLGKEDENLPVLERNLGVRIFSRGERIVLKGAKEDVEKAGVKLEKLLKDIGGRKYISKEEINFLLSEDKKVTAEGIVLPRKVIRPRTGNQAHYLEMIEKNSVVFAIGPAGTGKTYLAVAAAVSYLLRKRVSRIVLTRPAVEAGESLGFLPGGFIEKVDPYLRPLYDALYDMLPADRVKRYIDNGTIEIAPLAFMRGRTLNDAFVILDEAQNTTHIQMKMMLTRIGENSRLVVTGDITQVDLPETSFSGLIEIQEILKDVDGVVFVYLSNKDVVRNDLVRKIVKAYEEYEKDK